MRSISWADAALADLAKIDDWYAERDPDYAAKIGFAAIEATSFLARFPLAGPLIALDIRKWPVPGTDYRILYCLTDTLVEVVRIRHSREDWQSELE